MDNSRLSKFPIVESFSKRLVEYCNADELINEVIAELGVKFAVDSVVIKQVVEGEMSVCCNYEWSSNGNLELIGCEGRYSEAIWDKWLKSYDNPMRVWVWNKNDGYLCPVQVIRVDIANSVMQVPVYMDGRFSGCIDFVLQDVSRIWKNDEIEEANLFADVLGEYFLANKNRFGNLANENSGSLYDRTTHLPKYEYFLKQVEMSLFELSTSQLVIASIDFSNFKYINEKWGHAEGDLFLECFARNIYEYSKYVITSCRSHSDNFLILIKCNKIFTKTQIKLKLENIASEIIREYTKKYFDIALCINVGFYSIKNMRESIEGVISNANLARKYAKLEQQDKGCCCLNYDTTMSTKFRTQAEYITEMSTAIDKGEFYFDIQPIVRADSEEIVAGEALVRWKKDNFYRLMPSDFISLFEMDGCIVKMDAYTYDRVFAYLRDRLDRGLKVVPMVLNVSVVHFRYEVFVGYFDSLQEKYHIPAELIYFDFPEQAFTSKLENTKAVVFELRKRGYKVFVDNFGSGFSSLNTLTAYDLDGIKIDRVFMKSVLDREDKIIVSCVLDMAAKLGISACCEGVENKEQRDFLIVSGCEYLQGNLYSEAVSVEKFNEMISVVK